MPTPLRILILEDQLADAELMLHELRQAGFDPEWQRVETEEEYLAALSPDLSLILADYSLPQFDARRALNLLQGRGLDIPFIVITGSISEEVAVECIKQGAADYLLKDRLTRLGQAVTHALDQKLLREEKRQADRALRESEERLRVGLRTANIAVFNQDTDLRYVWMYQPQLGYAVEQVIGHTDAELLPLEAAKQVREIKRHVLESGLRESAEVPISVGSQTFVYDLVAEPLRDVSGAIIGLTGASLDITERKRVEEALRRNEALLLQTSKMAKVGGWELDLPTMSLLWSLETYRIHEVDSSFQPNLENAINFYTPEARPIISEAVRRASEEGRPYDLELPSISAKGRHIWVRTIGQTEFRNGKCVRFFGTLQDITERKQMEMSLAESEKNYQTLFENMPVGLYRTTSEGRMIDANPAMVKMFGFQDREALLAMKAEDLYTDPVDNTKFLQAIHRSDIVSNFETEMRRRDGSTFWGSDNVRINRDDKGNILYYEGSMVDITERKWAEEQIRQRLGELEVLYQSGLALSQSLKPKEIAQRIIDLLDQNLGWHHTTVRLYHPQDETLELLAFNQPGLRSEQEKHAVEEHFKTSVAKKSRGLSGWVIERGQSVRTSDLMNDARYVETFPGLRSGLYVPIIIGERTIGVISIESEEENAFSEADERLTVTLANQAASALENARLFEETSQRLTRIQSLRNIDMAISGSTDLRVTLNVALDEIVNQLGIDAACILRLDPHTQTLEYAAGRGFRTHTIEKSLVRLGEGHAGRAALERRPAHIADLSATGAEFARAGLLASEGFKTYHAIPLIAKGQVLGVLEVFHRAAFESNGEWLDFLETLAGQTVIAMDNTSLFQGLERSNINLLQAYDATIEGWSQAMDLRDKETEGHTQRVTKLTEQLARAIGMSHEEIVHARRGALLHDIGKIGVPDLILLKADKLTEEEWILMKSHPQFAYNMLSPIAYLKPALDIPYCHHEKWDGTGYPRGLKGEQIPLVARLFAIVDVYDALTSDRPYRKAWTKKKTFTYIREQSGTHFDPAVVDAFLAMQLPKRKK